MAQSTQNIHELNELSKEVIGHAISVHKNLGPGLLESVYEECLFMNYKKIIC
jgi:GxxExxY protein